MEPQIEVVGTANDFQRVLSELPAIRPDVVLLDRSMSDSMGAIRAILELAPSAKVVVLSVPENESDVIACAEAGAAGYVAKDASIDELIEVMKSAAKDELLCTPKLAGTLLRRIAALATSGSPARLASQNTVMLTVQQKRVLEQIERGRSNKEISVVLGIEVATVKNHVHRVLEKLGVRSRGEAAACARRMRLAIPEGRTAICVA